MTASCDRIMRHLRRYGTGESVSPELYPDLAELVRRVEDEGLRTVLREAGEEVELSEWLESLLRISEVNARPIHHGC